MTIRELDNLFKYKLRDNFPDDFYESYMNFNIFPGEFENIEVDISVKE